MIIFRRFICENKTLHIIRKCSEKVNVIRSKAKPVELPSVPVYEYVWKNVNKWPDKIATVCIETQRSYTYRELHKKSFAVTNFLRDRLKLNRGDTVMVVLPNLPEYPLVLLGALQAGLKVSTCNPTYTSDEITKQLMDCEAKVVFTSNQLLPIVQKTVSTIQQDLPIIAINEYNHDVTSGAISFEEVASGKTCDPVYVNDDEIAFLPYSSGTTGLPKGVELTHANIVANLQQSASPEFNVLMETSDNYQDVVPAFLPFFHIYGLMFVLFNVISQGGKLVTIPKFGSQVFIKLLKEYKATVVHGVPNTVHMSINNPHITPEDLSCIRTMVSGAAPLGGSDVERFRTKTKNRVNLFQAYGMTETSPLTLIQTEFLDNGLVTGGSGLLVPNTEAKIIPVDGSSTIGLRAQQSGELLFRGPQIMKGYFNKPKATQEVFIEDGWFKTGDIGYYDENGHFFVTDRLKELIKVKGFQVAPAELEAILRSHPAVEDVAVIGVSHSLSGEVPKAFVVARKKVSPQELQQFLAQKVTKYKQLEGGVVFIDSIPKNASGKILRKVLRNM